MQKNNVSNIFDLNLIRSKFNSINWDFPNAGNVSPMHMFPRYPGNFIYQLPSYLIQLLSKPGEIVFDPFCGSGTTGLEASKLGRRAILFDGLMVSSEISLYKSLIILKKIVDADLQKVNNELMLSKFCNDHELSEQNEGSDPKLTHWYSKATLHNLRIIWRNIKEADSPLKEAMLLSFFEILSACASTRRTKTKSGGIRKHHWGWIADNVLPKQLINHDCIAMFINTLRTLVNSIDLELFKEPFRVIRHDISLPIPELFLPPQSVDLIITSPPYLGVIDYTKAHRLQYMWMGWDLHSDITTEIGARCHRNLKSTVDRYQRSISKSFENAFNSLKGGRFCAVILGESSKFPGITDDIFDLISRFGYIACGPISRVPSRRRLSSKVNQNPVEKICVFQKK